MATSNFPGVVYGGGVGERRIRKCKKKTIRSLEELETVQTADYPVTVKVGFAFKGMGGGIAHNLEELITLVAQGLDISLAREVMLFSDWGRQCREEKRK